MFVEYQLPSTRSLSDDRSILLPHTRLRLVNMFSLKLRGLDTTARERDTHTHRQRQRETDRGRKRDRVRQRNTKYKKTPKQENVEDKINSLEM